MKRVHLGPEPLCRRARRVVGYIRIMLCRARVGVAEEAPDDPKVEAARNEVGSMGMPIFVQAIVQNARLLGDCFPELFDVLKELAGHGFAAGDRIAVGADRVHTTIALAEQTVPMRYHAP